MRTFRDLGVHGGSYLRASDIPDTGWLLTITAVDAAEVEDNGRTVTKPYVTAAEIPEQIILNVTNRSSLESAFGENLDAWIGRQIVCRKEYVRGPNGMTWGVRLYPHQAAPVPAAPAPVQAATAAAPPAPAAAPPAPAPVAVPPAADWNLGQPPAAPPPAPTLSEELNDSIPALDKPTN